MNLMKLEETFFLYNKSIVVFYSGINNPETDIYIKISIIFVILAGITSLRLFNSSIVYLI